MNTTHRIKNNQILTVVFLCCWFLVPFCRLCEADTGSERKVVVEQVKYEPIWKIKWDGLRELVRQKKFQQAAKGYGELLSMKSNIEEARWEYLQLLIRLEEWDQASDIVESLIEKNPQSMDYRLRGGEIATKRKEFERAAKYFGWALTKSPNSSNGLIALQGLIDALHGLGRDEMVLPLMEQLYLRKPDDPDTLKKMASIAMAQGKMGKAADYYAILIDHFPIADRIIYQAANIYDQMGKKDRAVLYWKKYLENHPEYIPFQKKISDYYLSINKKAYALPHLIFLLENGKQRDQLILQIGRIYLHDLKRPDKALVYLQEYLEKYPNNSTVANEILEIQTVLANDLISIVENNGAWMLWRDLAQLTPNRVAIYLSMVDLLESLGKEKEMYEILNIIYKHDPNNREALLGLADIMLRKNRMAESVDFFNRVTGNLGIEKKYYLVKGKIQEKLGNELLALSSFEQYLYFDRENRHVLWRCFELSGELGLVDRLKKHYLTLYNTLNDKKASLEAEKKYLQYLRKNNQFKESETVHADLIKKIGDDPIETTQLLFLRADFLYEQGLVFEAEQLLRRVLISNVKTREALIRLVQLAIDEKEIDRSLAWFSLLRSQPFTPADVDINLSDQDLDVTLLQIKLFDQQQKDDEAIAFLEKIVFNRKKEKFNKIPALQLIQLYRQNGFSGKGLKLAENLMHQYPNELEVKVLLRNIRSSLLGKDVKLQGTFSFSKLVQLARFELKYGGIKNGLFLIDEAIQRVKLSVEARVVNAQLLLKDEQLLKSLQIFQELLTDFPENQYFEKMVLEISLSLHKSDQIVHKYYEDSKSADKKAYLQRGFSAWKNIILAQALTHLERFEEADEIYKKMISTPIEKMLIHKIKKGDVSEDLLNPGKSIWDIITFSSPIKKSLVDTVMAPYYVGKHLGKRIDIISTELYAEYKWQMQIMTAKVKLYDQLQSNSK